MKIKNNNKESLILNRADGAQYESVIKHISSTSLQPYMGINFLDGAMVGGRTMTLEEVKNLLAHAKKMGLIIEDELQLV